MRSARSCNSSAELLRAYREDGESRPERLIEAYIPLVVSIAVGLRTAASVSRISFRWASTASSRRSIVRERPELRSPRSRSRTSTCQSSGTCAIARAIRIPRRYQEVSVRGAHGLAPSSPPTCAETRPRQMLAAAAESRPGRACRNTARGTGRSPLTLADASNPARPQYSTPPLLRHREWPRLLPPSTPGVGLSLLRRSPGKRDRRAARRLPDAGIEADRLRMAEPHHDFEGDLRRAGTRSP